MLQIYKNTILVEFYGENGSLSKVNSQSNSVGLIEDSLKSLNSMGVLTLERKMNF